MKPASFDYHDPSSLDEALELMAQFGDDARPLAGGQSLVPLMNFRLLRPAHLVDLNRIDALSYVREKNGALYIGAMTRQRQLERAPAVAQRWLLLQEATAFIGHVQIRNRGTVGGSLAHAFPSAELPIAMATLDASMVLQSKKTRRVVSAEEFFVSTMSTAIEPGELLTEIRVPAPPDHAGSSYKEVNRRHGDFALAAAAALVALDDSGRIVRCRLTFAGATPLRAREVERSLVGEMPSAALFEEAARHATEKLEQDSDVHASAEYRRQASATLARRALSQAAERAAQRARGAVQ
ncbi:MAG TPA: xanthine dehydrogenase family protein subunit M [Candidatus Eisenbacteria bacterium]|nr:xanthine dehydrogenase family protein subunit M [Candidatus Eisenbacteria bacterium]